jgi:hypothetical protein
VTALLNSIGRRETSQRSFLSLGLLASACDPKGTGIVRSGAALSTCCPCSCVMRTPCCPAVTSCIECAWPTRQCATVEPWLAAARCRCISRLAGQAVDKVAHLTVMFVCAVEAKCQSLQSEAERMASSVRCGPRLCGCDRHTPVSQYAVVKMFESKCSFPHDLLAVPIDTHKNEKQGAVQMPAVQVAKEGAKHDCSSVLRPGLLSCSAPRSHHFHDSMSLERISAHFRQDEASHLYTRWSRLVRGPGTSRCRNSASLQRSIILTTRAATLK